MTQAEMFRNLLLMAAVDGRMAESELRLLSDRATEWGISDEEFEAAIQQAIQGTAEFTIPRDRGERADLIKEMICMMADSMQQVNFLEQNIFEHHSLGPRFFYRNFAKLSPNFNPSHRWGLS